MYATDNDYRRVAYTSKLAKRIRFSYDLASSTCHRSKNTLQHKVNWVMALPDRETIQRLWKIKKLIRAEFDSNIQINQVDLEQTLRHYLAKTKSHALKILISQTLPDEKEYADYSLKEKATSKKKIIYRGQTLPQQKEPA